MLRAGMAQVAPPDLAEQHAAVCQHACRLDLPAICPAGRAESLRLFRLARAPNRQRDCDDHSDEHAADGDQAASLEYLRSVGIEREPPPEESRWRVDWTAAKIEPRLSEFWLISERMGGPLRRSPNSGESDPQHGNHLTP